MLSVFFSCSNENERLCNQLEQQLSIFMCQQVIATWHDRRIAAGEEIDHAISDNLEAAGTQ